MKKFLLPIFIFFITGVITYVSFLQHENIQKRWLTWKLCKAKTYLLQESEAFLKQHGAKHYPSHEVAVWVFLNDSLVWWTRHDYPLMENSLEMDTLIKLAYIQNGWYMFKKIEKGDSTILFQFPIFLNHSLHNEYVQPYFSSFFHGINRLYLLPSTNTDSNKQISLTYFNKNIPYKYVDTLSSKDKFQWLVPLLLYLLVLLLLAEMRWILSQLKKKNLKANVMLLIVLLTGILLWYLLDKFYSLSCWQGLLIHRSDFFALSMFFSSLSKVINVLIAMVWVIVLGSDLIDIPLHDRKTKLVKYLSLLFFMVIVWGAFTSFISVLENFFLNSSWFSNFKDIATMDIFHVWLLLPIALFLVVLYMLFQKCIQFIDKVSIPLVHLIFLFVIGGGVSLLLFPHVHLFVFVIQAVVMVFFFLLWKKSKGKAYEHVLLYGFMLAVIGIWTVFAMQNAFHKKLKQSLKIHSLRLTTQRDFLGEYVMEQKASSVEKEKKVYEKGEWSNTLLRFFQSGYLSRFKAQVVVCGVRDSIVIRPYNEKVNCFDYFHQRIQRVGEYVRPHVYYMKDDWRGYYLVHLTNATDQDTLHAFIELLPMMLEKTVDYPNLLVDETADVVLIPSFISYAQYQKKQLNYSKGKYVFPLQASKEIIDMPYQKHIETSAYYFYKAGVNDEVFYLLVGEKMNFSHVWTAFSFVLFILLIMSVILFSILFPEKVFRGFEKSLASKFQQMLIWFIIATFAISVVIAIHNLLKYEQRKNKELLMEKGFELVHDLENKLSENDRLFDDPVWLSSYVLNYGFQHLIEINLFGKNGSLLATTRPELFERFLLSSRMNPHAYFELKSSHNPYIILRENIEQLHFYSAYFPIRNSELQLLGFVQVPYFTREQQYNDELFSLLSSMVNIYLLILFLALLLAYVLTYHITKPLNMIKQRMKTIRLSGSNEKIAWEGSDEISELIKSYNAMVDELAEKAKQLATTERELAWKEMARQVAHEINNPITPMKLSTQYIYKAWQKQDKDFHEKFERYIKSMQMQIESLHLIASSFSMLGKLMQPDFREKTRLGELFQDVQALFVSDEFELFIDLKKDIEVIGHYQHLRQVLINLVKNAIQAFLPERKGKIVIGARILKDDMVEIYVQDNGRGIPEEEKSKIFQPNFTTKTSGSGLGLAIAKAIVEMYGGNMHFTSMFGEGTTFYFTWKKG